MDIRVILAVFFVIFFIVKIVTGLKQSRRRMLWAGSEPITDEELRQWFFEVWWETYEVIDPADRVNHTPTPHWWMYKDHTTFLPSYLGNMLIGWWAKDQRAIFVTERSKNNRNLVRHECAHDIMNSIEHSSKYFDNNTYVMKQFQ